MQTEEPVFAPHAAPRLHLPEIHHLGPPLPPFPPLSSVGGTGAVAAVAAAAAAAALHLHFFLPLLSSLSLSLSRGDYSSSIREMNRLDSRCANLSDTVRASFSFSTLNCRPGYEAGFVNSCSVWIPKIINLPRFEN